MKVKSLRTLAALAEPSGRRQAQPVVCNRCQKSFRSAEWFHRHQCAPAPPLPEPTPKRCCCGRGYITHGMLARHQARCGWFLVRQAMAADACKGTLK